MFWRDEFRSGRIRVQGPGARVSPGCPELGLVQAFMNNGRIEKPLQSAPAAGIAVAAIVLPMVLNSSVVHCYKKLDLIFKFFPMVSI